MFIDKLERCRSIEYLPSCYARSECHTEACALSIRRAMSMTLGKVGNDSMPPALQPNKS
jgi:hypothetical protein